MKKLDIVNSISRSIHKVGFQAKKHSPEILVGVGVVGVVGSCVLACFATTKISGVLEKTKEKTDMIHQGVKDGKVIVQDGSEQSYSEEEGKKDLTIIYAKTGLELVKLYTPAVLLGAASLSCILASNNILNKRNAALAAAYATVDSNFKDYRNRLIDRFGKELDRELRYDIKATEVEEIITHEDGTEEVVKTTIEIPNADFKSEYARCFDETCTCWTRSAEHNLTFVNNVQSWANRKLREEGFLFLNEVYEALGFQKSKAGQVVGWIYDEENPNGENYVNFFIYDLHDKNKRRFVNGYEKSIWLDFNVDGNIWELMQ